MGANGRRAQRGTISCYANRCGHPECLEAERAYRKQLRVRGSFRAILDPSDAIDVIAEILHDR